MPHKFLLSSALLSALFAATICPAQDIDSVKDKLAKAKSAHQSETAEQRQKLLDLFQAKEDNARKARVPDKKLVDRIKAEREAFNDKGVLPKSFGLGYREATKAANDKYRKACSAAVSDCIRIGADDLATTYQSELDEFELASGYKVVPKAMDISCTGRNKNFEIGRETVCAVWFEDGFWHLRTTVDNKGGNNNFRVHETFMGTIRVRGGAVAKVFPESLELKARGPEHDELAEVRGGVNFIFRNTGGMDGIRFKLSDKVEEFTVEVRVGGDANPRKIRIGPGGVIPEHAIFTLPAVPKR